MYLLNFFLIPQLTGVFPRSYSAVSISKIDQRVDHTNFEFYRNKIFILIELICHIADSTCQ